ncbi:MAG: squalene synthase HpnC [Magnetococcus sp. DMHC-6]
MSKLKPIPTALLKDFLFCKEFVRSHSENFPVGSLLAPRRLRPHLHAIYAFARSADDFADLPGRNAQSRLQLLDSWSQRLIKAEADIPDHPIFNALSYTIRATKLPTLPLHHLLTAFRMDVTNKRYDTLEELFDYCHYSANPVGRILLHLANEQIYEVAAPTPAKFLLSDAICTALQLTNHLQDLGEDSWSGRPLYIPKEKMQKFDVDEQMILSRRFSPNIGHLMLEMIAITRELFYTGEPLLHTVPWPLNLELSFIWESGMNVLDLIEESGGNTLRVRPNLSTKGRFACFRKALQRVLS